MGFRFQQKILQIFGFCKISLDITEEDLSRTLGDSGEALEWSWESCEIPEQYPKP